MLSSLQGNYKYGQKPKSLKVRRRTVPPQDEKLGEAIKKRVEVIHEAEKDQKEMKK